MFLQSSVSGLQRLFSTSSSSFSPHTPRGQRQLESVTEEAHTYDLLYPQGETLRQGQHHAYPLRHGDPVSIAAAANSSDDRGGLDIQSPRDIRIIIAQDTNALSMQPCVMYDSCPLPLPQVLNSSSPEATESSRPRAGSLTGGFKRSNSVQKPYTAPHSRQSSLSQTAQSIFGGGSSPLSPVSELGGLFGGGKPRDTTRLISHDGESRQSKIIKEEREETEELLECMFGAAGLPSISSTKLHVRPPRPRDIEHTIRPSSAREPTSPGAFPKTRTPLTRSTTAADLQTLSSKDAFQITPRPSNSSILITRLFSVDPKDTLFTSQAPEATRSTEAEPSPTPVDLATGVTIPNIAREENAGQYKIPTYAVAFLLQLPPRRQRPLTPSLERAGSYAAVSLVSWPFDGLQNLSNLGAESNNDINYVIAHWNVLTRALSCLEVAARHEISNSLAKLEIPLLAPPIKEAPKSSGPEASARAKKGRQPTQRTLQLSPGALQNGSFLHRLSDMTGKRIALALRIRKVVAGQGRWGIWREEARWVGRWAGGKDQNFFLFNLLTAFLGSHTEWLDALGPSRYRRRHTKIMNGACSDVSSIQHRTVLVSQDKMAARRLIFLLSAFLPGSNFTSLADGQHDLDASWSSMAYSLSPPSGFPIHRQQSLRRTVNRRAGGYGSTSNVTSHARSVSFSSPELPPSDDNFAEGEHIQHRSRRASDARSIRSAGLPVTFNGSSTRKSSTTTTATVGQDPAIGVPHFSSHSVSQPLGTAAGPRPGSSGSLVSLSLKRTLSQSESNEQGTAITDSQSISRWGSMISGFWSDRRGSSAEESDRLASSEEGLGISGVPKDVRSRQAVSTLAQIVKKVDLSGNAHALGQSNSNTASSSLTATQLPRESTEPIDASPPKVMADTPGIEQFPLTLSIDEDDGVVDVELPPPSSYASSFESTMSSPIAMRSAASSFTGPPSLPRRNSSHASQHSSSSAAVDVAGWLRNYHQDFALQAVRPYDSLKEDIKRSMRTEPTPNNAQLAASGETSKADDWTEVCTTLVADTTTFSVTRLCLRRKNPTSTHHQADALLEITARDHTEQEEIIEEPLMDMDPTFIDAVEKVLAQSGHSSRVGSRANSRAPSPSRHRSHSLQEDSPGHEVPRSECKRMVLGALEQVARSVSAELAKGKDIERQPGRRDAVPTDSTLREGVRRWLSQVDKEGS